MTLKSEWLKKSDLYLVLDTSVEDYEALSQIASKAAGAGVNVIQLRDKNGSDRDYVYWAKEIAALVKNKALFIVNDRVHLMNRLEADGVHIGQGDCPLKEARDILGPGKLIGVSCQTYAHTLKAQQDGADYIGLGSVYKTPTKPGRGAMDCQILEAVSCQITIPVFAIGGITTENLQTIIKTGIRRVAVTRAILQADDVETETAQFKKRLKGLCAMSSVDR